MEHDETVSMEELLELEREALLLETEAEEVRQSAVAVSVQKTHAERTLQDKTAEVAKLRSDAASLQRSVEEEEEYIANALLKRLDALQRDKEQLAHQVEVEEEFLANSLQKQLSHLSKEKDELEKHLQRERRFIVTKLKKQLRQAMDQKRSLEKIVQADGDNLLNHLQQYKQAVGDTDGEDTDQTPQPRHHRDPHHTGHPAGHPLVTAYDSDSSTFSTYSESQSVASGLHSDTTIRKLQKEITRLHQVCQTNESAADVTAHKCDSLRDELERLSQDNFLKEVKAIRLGEELSRASGERRRLVMQSEAVSEGEGSRRRQSTSSNPKHLKAQTELILTRPPTSPLSTLPSMPPSCGATPPLTPCISPRSVSSGASTPTLHHHIPFHPIAAPPFRRDVSSSSESSRAPSDSRRGSTMRVQRGR